MDAGRIFLDYAEGYDRSNGKIELKIIHTFGVADIMDRLTAALELSERQKYMAHICAVFHDIGRFEQVKRYDTFLDHLSVDHAALSCEVLKQENMLHELSPKEQKMVLTAIANHNRFAIEDGLDEDTLLLCKLIRDADKCDIFRVFACEEMVDTMGETVEQVEQETVSDSVFQCIMEHKCILKEKRETGLDKWVSFLAFFFDMYFDESISLLLTDKYYRRPFDEANFVKEETKKRVDMILDEIECYISGRVSLQEGNRVDGSILLPKGQMRVEEVDV